MYCKVVTAISLVTIHTTLVTIFSCDERFQDLLSLVVQLLSHFQLCSLLDCSIAGLRCPSLSPGFCSDSCPLSQWYHPAISSSVTPFSSCLQSFPASGSFPMGWLFALHGQSTGASASVLPMSIQSWSSLISHFKGEKSETQTVTWISQGHQ